MIFFNVHHTPDLRQNGLIMRPKNVTRIRHQSHLTKGLSRLAENANVCSHFDECVLARQVFASGLINGINWNQFAHSDWYDRHNWNWICYSAHKNVAQQRGYRSS